MSKRGPHRSRVLRRAVAEYLEPRRLLSTSYTITDIGTLPGGTSSVATAINASGEVAGYSDTDGNNDRDHAFTWTASGGLQDLGTLPGDVFSHAEAINSAGDVVGFSRDSQGTDNAFMWTPGVGMVDLGTLVGGGSSEAYGINDSGMVVGQATIAGGVERAFVWTQAGGMQDIGTLGNAAGNASFATAVNNSSQVVGSAQNNGGDYHAFLWTSAGGMLDLGTLFADTSSVAFGINAAGQITGSSGVGVTTAFLWTAGGTAGQASNPQMAPLDDLGGNLSEGDAINSNGQVVGYSEDPVTQYIDATTWTSPANPADDLNFDIPSDSGWGLDEAYSINDTGFIVGSGEAPNGDENAFFLTPVGAAGPGEAVFAPNLTTAGATETVSVFYYSDSSAIDPSTFNSSNITVTGPSGPPLGVTYTGMSTGNGYITATYNIAAPDGTWDAADTGTYTVNVVGGSVKDMSGAGVSTASTTFLCNLEIDPTFSPTTNGNVTLAFTSEQVLPESDGNILSIGHRGDSADSDLQGVLESFTSTNTIDPAFATATGGVVSTPTSAGDAFYGGVIQPDGKILAVGGSNGKFLVARYNADGTPDTTFGTGGFATADFGAYDPATASSVVIEPNGAILVGGVANGSMAVARFTSTGSLDTTFNASGELTISTGAVSTLSDLLLQGDGKILGVGNDGTGVAVFRLNADGSSDSSFGTSGIVTLSQLASKSSDNSSDLESLGIQPGGAILVAGQAADGDLGVVRLTSAGQVDSTFSGGGFVNVSFGGTDDRADDVLVNAGDGSFILIGTSDAGSVLQTAIAAFNPDGSINTGFGLNGKTTFPGATGRTTSTTPSTSSTNAFHPQLSDFSTGAIQSDGHVLIENANTSAAGVRRIEPFSTAVAPTVNTFGKVGRKNVKLPPFTLANGTTVTITLTGGGTGTESNSGNNVTLDITSPASLTIKTKGGANTLNLAAVSVSGKLNSLTAPTAILTGTLSIPGSAGTIALGGVSGVLQVAGSIANLSIASVSGSVSCGGILQTGKFGSITGTVAAGVRFNNLTISSLSGATLLAGTNLGTDGQLGGSGTDADTYYGGAIYTMKVTGTIANSFIGAGVDPTDGVFGNSNDTAAGTGIIRSLTVKGGIDSASKFEASSFPRYVHIPLKTSPIADARFIML